MSEKPIIIGTRGSLLALTQCTLFKEELESKSGLECQLKTITTEGDQKIELPLWQMEGKDFFTKELDHALLAHEVDMVVHSYKDLGSERPHGIELAAIGKRQYAHDILLIRQDVIDNLANIPVLEVGTSSPRRITNIESTLGGFLPQSKGNSAQVKCKHLRGNVNTRIQKLRDGQYHAIVLALAGLERLALRADSGAKLKELLHGLNFMVLGQKDFPSSASQGALAVEVAKTSPKYEQLKKALAKVNDIDTQEAIRRERKAFVSYGGGCHLAVGIHVRKHKDHFIHIHKGEQDHQKISKLFLEDQSLDFLKGKNAYFVLGEKDQLVQKEALETSSHDPSHVFVTSQYCLQALGQMKASSLWAAGSRTHKILAQSGRWVNGSADGLGHEEICALQKSKALGLMMKSAPWKVLSHDQAQSPVGENIPAYRRTLRAPSEEFIQKLKMADVFFWGSFFQYQSYCERFPFIKEKLHCCGLGKTYDRFKQANIDIIAIVDMLELKNLVNEIG